MIWRYGKIVQRIFINLIYCWSVHIRILILCPISPAGDAIVLYERNVSEDNVTNKMVFKGNIEEISDCNIRIRLRAAQQNVRSCQWKAAMQ